MLYEHIYYAFSDFGFHRILVEAEQTLRLHSRLLGFPTMATLVKTCPAKN